MAFYGLMIFAIKGLAQSDQAVKLVSQPEQALDSQLAIEADVIRCHAKENKCTAEGHATAVKKDIQLLADEVEAFASSHNPKKRELVRVVALRNVELSSPQGKAFGQKAIYEVKTDVVRLLGPQVKVEASDGKVLIAKNSIAYDHRHKQIDAPEDVILLAKEGTIESDTMTAFFKEMGDQKILLHEVKAVGHVIVRMEEKILRADRVTYDAKHQRARAVGNVEVFQKGHYAAGHSAIVDFLSKSCILLPGSSMPCGEKQVCMLIDRGKKDSTLQSSQSPSAAVQGQGFLPAIKR